MDRYRIASMVFLAGVLCFFFWGWSSCTTARIVRGRGSSVKVMVHTAVGSIKESLYQGAKFGFPNEWIQSHGPKMDLRNLADFAVNDFFTQGNGENVRGIHNPYSPQKGAYVHAAKGSELGSVYIDTTRVEETGLVSVIGIYLDPYTHKNSEFVRNVDVRDTTNGLVRFAEAPPLNPGGLVPIYDKEWFTIQAASFPRESPFCPPGEKAGTITVEVLIGQDGTPLSARAIDGRPQLRTAAETYAMAYRWSPPVFNGVPAQVRTELPVSFQEGRLPMR